MYEKSFDNLTITVCRINGIIRLCRLCSCSFLHIKSTIWCTH